MFVGKIVSSFEFIKSFDGVSWIVRRPCKLTVSCIKKALEL